MSEFESETLLAFERTADAREFAALLDEVGTAFAERRPATLDDEGTRVAIDPPSRAVLEFDLEREGGGIDGEPTTDDADGATRPTTIDLEVELEWNEAAEGPGSVRVDPEGAAGDGKAQKAAADEAQTTLSAPSGDEGSGESGDDGPTATPSGDGRADEAARTPRRSRFEVYRDRADEWRWRLVHWNGNVIADGGEGYASRYNAERAVRSVMRTAPDARVKRLERE